MEQDYNTIEISIHPNSNIKCIKFLLNGKLHNSRGPAKLIYSENEQLVKEYYYINGKKSRLYAPAVITYYYDKNKEVRISQANIISQTNISQQASISQQVRITPQVRKLEYFYKGYRHNKYGAAIIKLDKYGNKRYETHYNLGVLHNTEGPAYHDYAHNKKRWIVNGIEQH